MSLQANPAYVIIYSKMAYRIFFSIIRVGKTFEPAHMTKSNTVYPDELPITEVSLGSSLMAYITMNVQIKHAC